MTKPQFPTQASATYPSITTTAANIDPEARSHSQQRQIAALEAEKVELHLRLRELQDRNREITSFYTELWRRVCDDVGGLTSGVEAMRRSLQTLGIDGLGNNYNMAVAGNRNVEGMRQIRKDVEELTRENEALVAENEVLEEKWRDAEDRGICLHEQWKVRADALYTKMCRLKWENGQLKDGPSSLETDFAIPNITNTSLEPAKAKLQSVLEQMKTNRMYIKLGLVSNLKPSTSDVQDTKGDMYVRGGNEMEMSLGGETLTEFDSQPELEAEMEPWGEESGSEDEDEEDEDWDWDWNWDWNWE